jgi:ribonucleotide reductase alpha subunit
MEKKKQYKINIKHPLFEAFLKRVSSDELVKKEFKQILKYIENYLPVDNIFARKANNEVEQSSEIDEKVYDDFKEILGVYKLKMDVNKAFTKLMRIEPYNSLTFNEELLNEIGVDINKI